MIFRFWLLVSAMAMYWSVSPAQWFQTNGPDGGAVYAVAAVPRGGGGENVFAGTGTGVFLSSNEGATWSAVTKGLETGLVRALTSFTSNGGVTYILAGTAKGVFLSTDDGARWSFAGAGLPNDGVTSFQVVPTGNGGTILYAGTWNGVYQSTDNSTTWQITGMTTGGFVSLAVFRNRSGGTTLLAASGSWGIYRSTDYGATWYVANAGLLSIAVFALTVLPDGKGGTNLFAGTYFGVYSSNDDGLSWSQAGLLYITTSCLAATPNGEGGTTLFAGTGSRVFSSTNNGSSWNDISLGISSSGFIEFAISGQYLYAATYQDVWRRRLAEIGGPRDPNLITNPGFESGREPWLFYTDGSGEFSDDAPGAGTPHACRLAIAESGTNVQLYQPAIHLAVGERYRLSFKAYSNTGHDCRVAIHKHTPPYTSYGLDGWEFDLGTSWKTFMTEFSAEDVGDSVGDARLKFWFAPYAQAGDEYHIDDVELRRTESNLVVNGGFEWGSDPWKLYTDGSAALVTNIPGMIGGYEVKLKVVTPGTNLQLFQSGIVLRSGIRYRLSFRASCSTSHDLSVSLHKNEEPYTNYGLDRWTVDLIGGWKVFSTEFTAEGFVGTVHDARLRFWFAPYAAPGDQYYFDEVLLTTPGISNTSEKVLAHESGCNPQPEGFSLEQNYPNPVNPSSTIRYGLPNRSHVTLTVFNTLGQQVATLVQGEQDAGYHEVPFDGSKLASGVYLYRMQVRSVLRQAEDESLALRGSGRADPLDPAFGHDSGSGAGEFVQTRRLILLR